MRWHWWRTQAGQVEPRRAVSSNGKTPKLKAGQGYTGGCNLASGRERWERRSRGGWEEGGVGGGGKGGGPRGFG